MSARNMRKIFEMNILGGRSGKIDQKRKGREAHNNALLVLTNATVGVEDMY